MGKEIKNIVFDFGGVLVDLDKERCIKAFDAIGAHEISSYVDECRQEDLFHDLEIGVITVHEFCDEVRRKSGSIATDGQISDAWNSLLVNIPSYRIEKLLQLHDHYTTYLLSNTNDLHWSKACKELFPYHKFNVEDYFEQIFLSYEMHLIKPSDAIFERMLDEAGIKAEETLFIDDSAANCAAAKALGIHTYLAKPDDDWTLKIE